MKIGVKILPRKDILDVQGRSIRETLKQYNYGVEDCRVGKYIQLDIEVEDEKKALKKAKEMMDFVLYNPLVETYEMEVL